MQGLTREEKGYLESFDGKLHHVRDAVRGVARDYQTGFFLWGEGGTSKSYTVIEELKRLKVAYVPHAGRITGRGLVDTLEKWPSMIHLIEDAETMMDDRRAWGVLREALWSQDRKKPMERLVTWEAWRAAKRFIFTGGIVVVSNANLADARAEIRAIKSRVKVLQLDVTSNEIKALMKKICLEGYSYGDDFMSPDECWQVVSYIIDQTAKLKRAPDLRWLRRGFHAYIQHKNGESHNDWRAMLDVEMQERVVYLGRAAQKAEESRIAIELHKQALPAKDKIQQWKDKTGLGQAAYYRALNRCGIK